MEADRTSLYPQLIFHFTDIRLNILFNAHNIQFLIDFVIAVIESNPKVVQTELHPRYKFMINEMHSHTI